ADAGFRLRAVGLPAQRLGLREGEAGRDVAAERIVRAGLVGDHVSLEAAAQELGVDLGGVADHADRDRRARRPGLLGPADGLLQRARHTVEVAGLQAAADARRVYLRHQRHPV